MSVHDSYARLTPYELSFPDLAWARTRFPAIREEATARKVEAGDPDRFIQLAAVGQMLRDIRPQEEPAVRIHSHGILLYHAFHFWEAGEHLYLVDAASARRLADPLSGRAFSPELPTTAGYAQLPQHLFWTGGEPDQPPESVDGFFWTSTHTQLHLLMAAGLRQGRPGFSVGPLAPIPLNDLARWSDVAARDEGVDFSSSLPGSELEGLHQLTTPGEVLKLFSRLWAAGGRVTTEEHVTMSNSPAPSRLPYKTITL